MLERLSNGLGPVGRIVLRYLIGFAAGQGILPDQLADMLLDSPEALVAIEVGTCIAAGACVEKMYLVARRLGLRL
jgi:hypothetical protein